MSATKKQLLNICDKLGEGYYITCIDFENVIAKDIKSTFQLEVSFLNPSLSNLKANIYVWQIKDGVRVIEDVKEIKSFDKIQSTLNFLSDKYSNLDISDLNM